MAQVLLDKREPRIRRMFGHIAPSYDLLNHLLSLNVDRYWRWRTTKLVPPTGDGPILDLGTGTGDLALAYDRAAGGKVPIVGADFCHEMLQLAGANAPIKLLAFADTPVVSNPTTMGMLKSAAHPNAALVFIKGHMR